MGKLVPTQVALQSAAKFVLAQTKTLGRVKTILKFLFVASFYFS